MSVSSGFFARALVLIILLVAPALSAAQIVLCTKAGGGGGSTQDIPGGSTTAGFVDCINITSVSEGVGRAVSQGSGGTMVGGLAFSEISLSKVADAASVNLRREAVNPAPRTEWVIHTLRTCNGNTAVVDLEIRLIEVLVSSFSSASTPSDPASESLSLSFRAINYKQNIFDESCSVTGDVQFGWDLSTSQPL